MLTAAEFRKMALSFSGAAEGEHMGHADFRMGGWIFASLGPDEDWGMVKLTPEQQAELLREDSAAYRPASGAWGEQGCTIVTLEHASKSIVRSALQKAWRNTSEKKPKKKAKKVSGSARSQ